MLVPLGVGIYSFRHRSVNGALQYGWIAINRFVGNLAFVLEMSNASLNGKIFWHSVGLLSLAVIAVLFAAFVLAYTDHKLKNPKLTWAALLFIPIVYLLLLLTNNLHGWVFHDIWLETDNPFSPLHYEVSLVTWALTIYGIAVALVLVGMLIGKFVHAQPLYRAQAFAVAFGFIIGIIGIAIASAGFQQIGIFPLASIVVHLIIAWGLFRYRLFDLRPIARETLFEKMPDLVFVLDAQNRIVDINRSAQRYFNLTPSRTIGKLAEPIFSRWPELLKKFNPPTNSSIEVAVKRKNKYRHFDVRTTLLHDRRGQFQGRILVARNITAYSALQWKQNILNKELKKLNRELEQRVRERTEELAQAYDTTLQGWAKALELRDKETEGHSRRVTEMTLKLARALDVAESEFDDLRRGALLHDIGKMAIPDEILRKADNLTPEEREIVDEHPAIAYQLLSPIKFLEKALEIPYCHHERWDGNGYPRGLKGEEIPLSARIFSVVDVWDAIQSNRSYRKAWPKAKARTYIKKEARQSFDPRIVHVFLDLMQQGKI
ncbi:MAG: HD domain-containing protein [Chloroflexi bacterium]|nr:HD domain-containing protein [Chloroflexota bacterium]